MEQDRYNHKVDPTVDHKGEFRRVEVITGVGLSPDKLDPVIHLIDARTVRVPHCHDMSTQRRRALTMFADHDAYIAEAPQDLRPLLVRLRAQLARALPDAEEVIAYKMPGFRIGKSIIAGYDVTICFY